MAVGQVKIGHLRKPFAKSKNKQRNTINKLQNHHEIALNSACIARYPRHIRCLETQANVLINWAFNGLSLCKYICV